MKKILVFLLLALMIFISALPALAETFEVPMPEEPPAEAAFADTATVAPEQEPMPDPTTGPWTWAYLATIAGATASTLLITQFIKAPLDKVWKIPTRLFVYLLALVIMVVATAFTSGVTLNSFLLSALNAFIVALTAYGSYELTFAESDRLRNQ